MGGCKRLLSRSIAGKQKMTRQTTSVAKSTRYLVRQPTSVMLRGNVSSLGSVSSPGSTLSSSSGYTFSPILYQRRFYDPADEVRKQIVEDVVQDVGATAKQIAASGSTPTGDKKIDAMSSTGHLWFANVYPERSNFLDFRYLLTHENHTQLIPKLLPKDVRITRYIPREREGGVFVDFEASPRFTRTILQAMGKSIQMRKDKKMQATINAHVGQSIARYLKSHNFSAPLHQYYVRAYDVVGAPFYDDYSLRYPSNTVHIKIIKETITPFHPASSLDLVEADIFEADKDASKPFSKISTDDAEAASDSSKTEMNAEKVKEVRDEKKPEEKRTDPPPISSKLITEEALFFIMRDYGRIADIKFNSDQDVWEVEFSRVGSAVAVRNCLHRAKVSTILKTVMRRELQAHLHPPADDHSASTDDDNSTVSRFAPVAMRRGFLRSIRNFLNRQQDQDALSLQSGVAADPGTSRLTQAYSVDSIRQSWQRYQAHQEKQNMHQKLLFKVTYKPRFEMRALWTQITANWRPMLGAFIGTFGLATAFLFDPLRVHYIKKKVADTYHEEYLNDVDVSRKAQDGDDSGGGAGTAIGADGTATGTRGIAGSPIDLFRKTEAEDSRGYKMLSRVWKFLNSYYSFLGRKDKAPLTNLSFQLAQERTVELETLRHWLRQDPPERVMIFSGPRGDSKEHIVRSLLHGTPGVVFLDFAPLLERPTDERFFLSNLARMFGYFPSMSGIDQTAGVLDTVVPGASRAFGGSGSTGDQYLNTLNKILQFTFASLSSLRDETNDYGTKKNAETRPKANYPIRRRGEAAASSDNGNGGTNDGDGNGANQVAQQDPILAKFNKYPLFVIEGFTHENTAVLKKISAEFLPGLLRWAAQVSERKLAKVVFVTDGGWAMPLFLQTLADRPDLLDEQSWGDVPLPIVRKWLESSPYFQDADPTLVDYVLRVLGGRISDLEVLWVKLEQDGMRPQDAVNEMVESSAATVRNLLAGSHESGYTKNHIWRCIEAFALNKDEAIRYSAFIDYVCKGDEKIFRSMAAMTLCVVVNNADGQSASLRNVGGASATAESDPSLFQSILGPFTPSVSVKKEKRQNVIIKETPACGSGNGNSGTNIGTIGGPHLTSGTCTDHNELLRSRFVRPGSPLFGEVCSRLYEDDGLRAIYVLSAIKEDIEKEQKELHSLLAELDSIARTEQSIMAVQSWINAPTTRLRGLIGDVWNTVAIWQEQKPSSPSGYDVLEERKTFLITRIKKQQMKLAHLFKIKDRYNGDRKTITQKYISHAL